MLRIDRRAHDDAGTVGARCPRQPLAVDLLSRLTGLEVDVDDPNIAYVLSKLAIIRMVRRLPRHGARAVAGSCRSHRASSTPRWVDTAVEALPRVQNAIKGCPIPRLGSPDEIASVVAFLCSDGESYMTGSDVLVDGGSVNHQG